MDIAEVKAQAENELRDEQYRSAVEEYKLRLRNKKSLFDRLCPYRIVIIKKGE